jgi:hypothetical protein
MSIRRNEHGNFEESETHFVFNQDTKEVIGKQVGKEVKQLTQADIEVCKLRNFKYKMPNHLVREKDENLDGEGSD